MLAVPADRLPEALADLDPGNRALLDLSLRRGVSDADIGELLRKDPMDVARGRDAVLELLCDALDVNGHDRRERVREAVSALPDDAWRPAANRAAEPADEVEPELEPSPEPEAAKPAPPPPRDLDRAAASRELDDELYFEPEEERGSRRTAWLLILGGIAILGVLLALLLSGGDDDSSNESGSQPTPSQKGAGPAPSGDTAKLNPIGGGRGEGTFSVTDDGATITIDGLPNPAPGSYQVWLYNSIVDAKSLGTFPEGSGKLDVELPPDASKYQFLDVSREPDDANTNHSGQSVMRAPLGDLLSE